MINDEIEKRIRTKIQGYIYDPFTIMRDYHIENSEIEGYHGRELLELLQNAVDELEGTSNRCVCIELTGSTLKFSNNGTYFSEDGIISLMYSHLSPKYNKHKYIGNKGTGFRSVLNWSECVKIYSGDLSIEFSKKHANTLLDELLQEPNIAEYQAKNPDLGLATLVAPKIIEPLDKKEYDTVIEMELKADMVGDVSTQISQIDNRTLLFLNYLERLILIQNKEVTEYKKSIHDESDKKQATKLTTVKYSEEKSEEWIIAEKHGTEDGQDYFVTLAYKEDMSVKPDVLYSYFKTKISFPIPALVHGTFSLDANRNHLNQSELNKVVLQEACNLIIEVAKSICEFKVSYDALHLLALRMNFPLELNWANLEDFYLEAVMKSNILPNVNGTYISFLDDPKFYKSNLSNFLEGDHFNQLLIYSDDNAIYDFIDILGKRKKNNLRYNYEYITVAINFALQTMNIQERASCCAAFLTEYQYELQNNNCPNFILDADGKPVLNGQMVFIPSETSNDTFSQPPKYANVVYLYQPLLCALREEIKNSDLRDLSIKLHKFNVREYNLTEIVKSVLSNLKKRESKNSKKTVKCCKLTVLWLYNLWKKNKLQSISAQLQNNLYIPIISRAGHISDANILFLGSEYGNNITDNLFLGKDELFVTSPKDFEIQEKNIQTFIEFLLFIGVSKFPRIKYEQIILPTVDFKKIILSKLLFPLIADDNFYANLKDFNKKQVDIHQVKVNIIENFELIFTAPTKFILEWLKNDLIAQGYVTAEFELTTKCTVYLKEFYQQNLRETHDNIPSFMHYEFSRRLWVDVGEVRYAPVQCLFVKGIENRLIPHIIEPDIDAFIENPFKKASEVSMIKDLLLKIGASDDFATLSVSILYQILIKLPEVDSTGDISKQLYRSIINAQGLQEKHKNNHFYLEFIQKGKVFCKFNKGYLPISQAYYLTERTVSGEVIKDFNLISIPNRLSQDKIIEYLGVKSLKLKGKIVSAPIFHEWDKEFCVGWDQFKVYAFCYRIDNAKTPEISSIKALKVRLCNEIIADYGKGSLPLSDFSFLKETKEVYLKVPKNKTTFDQLRSNMDFCAAIAEIFVSTIDIQDETLYSRIRGLFGHRDSDRLKMILQDIDDISILTRTREILEHTKTKQETFLTNCEQFTEIDKTTVLYQKILTLNFDAINCIENGENIIYILNALNIDVEIFNNVSEFILDLCPYYLTIYEQYKELYKRAYKNNLYHLMIDNPTDIKETFLQKYNEYCDFIPDLENSTKLNVSALFSQKWELPLEKITIDVDEQWRKNREKFIENKDKDVVNILLANLSAESLLYFGITDKLEKLYLKELEKWHSQEIIQQSIRDATDVPSAIIKNIEVSAATVSNNPKDTHASSSTCRSVGLTRPRSNETWGAFAERIVYTDLKKKFTEVLWVSENAKKQGINPDGRAGYGYDMQYVDEHGKIIFVEVKSTSGTSIAFHITENELLFAEKNANNYTIAFITNIEDTNNIVVNFIDRLFVYLVEENRFENSRFLLSADNYIIRCEVKP